MGNKKYKAVKKNKSNCVSKWLKIHDHIFIKPSAYIYNPTPYLSLFQRQYLVSHLEKDFHLTHKIIWVLFKLPKKKDKEFSNRKKWKHSIRVLFMGSTEEATELVETLELKLSQHIIYKYILKMKIKMKIIIII